LFHDFSFAVVCPSIVELLDNAYVFGEAEGVVSTYLQCCSYSIGDSIYFLGDYQKKVQVRVIQEAREEEVGGGL